MKEEQNKNRTKDVLFNFCIEFVNQFGNSFFSKSTSAANKRKKRSNVNQFLSFFLLFFLLSPFSIWYFRFVTLLFFHCSLLFGVLCLCVGVQLAKVGQFWIQVRLWSAIFCVFLDLLTGLKSFKQAGREMSLAKQSKQSTLVLFSRKN